MRRILYLLVSAVLLTASPAFAQSPQTPQGVVGEIYEFYGDNGAIGIWPTDPILRPFFTDRLMGLLDADDQLAEQEGIGQLSFDPFVNAQDFALENLKIAVTEQGGDEARVEANFTNFGEPTRIVYRLVRNDGRWLIDEIEAPDGPYPWQLSGLLQAN